MDEDMDEFLEDFGSSPLSDAELTALLESARATEDGGLRRLVKDLRTLRWMGRILLARIEAEPVAPHDDIVKVARFLLRGEAAGGNERPA